MPPLGTLALLAALAVTGTAVARANEAPDRSSRAEAILARARATFRTRESRPFVVYTIVREERDAGAVVPAGTYTERVWFRSRDGAALARRMANGVVVGPMIAERPTLDGDVDPGPPTADIFELGAPSALATPVAADGAGGRVLAAITVRGEFDYRVTENGEEDGAVRLRLEPRREPERNRLREVWVDAQTAVVRRFAMRDRIYFASRTSGVPDTFEFREGSAEGAPAIVSVASIANGSVATDASASPSVHYRFEDVTFPASLPDWYFEAYTYAKHVGEAPIR
jgi:hypothetical protein